MDGKLDTKHLILGYNRLTNQCVILVLRTISMSCIDDMYTCSTVF